MVRHDDECFEFVVLQMLRAVVDGIHYRVVDGIHHQLRDGLLFQVERSTTGGSRYRSIQTKACPAFCWFGGG